MYGVLQNPLLRYSLFLLLVIPVVVAAGLFIGSPSRWISHAVTASTGLVLLAIVLLMGAAWAGRVRSLHFRNPAAVHRIAGTLFSGFIVGTFLLGLRLMIGHGEPVLGTLHGLLGLIVASLSLVQVVLSLAVSPRERIQKFHQAAGFLLALLFILQLLLGLNAAHLFGPLLD